MATDMVGYSALAHQNETKALRLVEEHRTVIRSRLREFDGREVKTIGDGFLIEFGSALNAALCAIEIQTRFDARNRDPDVERIQLRIGLHVGDVVEDGDDILGDAVNIAARLEPLAEAGGICVSGPVRDQVQNKIPYSFTELEHSFLKNIDTPIGVYSIDLPWHNLPAARVTPWTDREPELSALLRILSDAGAGRGAIVAISGEAGIGKTRLAEEVIRVGKAKGFRALRSRGFQGEPGVAYGHWADLMREYVRESPDPLLYKVCAGCLSQVVKLVPELAERLGPGPPNAALDPGQAQLRFFEGIAQFFRNLVKESPLLLLLDDLQWADAASLAVLDYLSRQVASSRLVIVVTHRDPEAGEEEPLTQLLSTLRRDRVVFEITLKRFDPENATRLVAAVLGDPRAVPEVAGVVRKKTGGNPLFVEELLRDLIEEHRLVRRREGWSIGPGAEVELPSRIRDVILQRVNRLDEAAHVLLAQASVLPAEFDLPLLVEVSGSDPETVLRFVERMLRARIFRENEIVPGAPVYRFADEQIRETLYTRIAVPRRQQYHLRTARALEVRGGTDPGSMVSDLAYHFERGGDSARAVGYSIRAGDLAAAVYAREGAITHYRAALNALVARPGDRTRFEVLDRLGTELSKLGRKQECVARWTEAAEGFERLGERRSAGDLFRRLWVERPEPETSEVVQNDIRRARADLEDGPPCKEQARLFIQLARSAQMSSREEEMHRYVHRALSTAAAVRDGALEAQLHAMAADIATSYQEGREELEQAIRLGLEFDLETAIRSYWGLGGLLCQGAGEMREGRTVLEQGIALAEKIHDEDLRIEMIGVARGFVAYFLGDLEVAAESASQCAGYVAGLGRPPLWTYAAILWVTELDRGHREEARKWAGVALDSGGARYWFGAFWLEWCHGRFLASEGDLEGASTRFHASLRAVRDQPWSYTRFLPRMPLAALVDCSIRRGQREDAERYLGEMRALSRPEDSPAAQGLLARAEGQCARARGDVALAVVHLQAGAERWAASGWKVEEGVTRFELARAALELQHVDEARSEVGRALELFERSGARPRLEEATAWRDAQLGPTSPNVAASVGG